MSTGATPRGRRTPIERAAIAGHLREQILSGLHLGRLVPGERLPSTRMLAAQLGVDQRRVTRAYHDLVVDGLVDLRPRSGFYVAADANGRQPNLRGVAGWAVDVLVDADRIALRPTDVAAHLRACLACRRLTAACIECNDDQIHGLSVELEGDYGFVTRSVALDRLDEPDVRTALGGADVLVTTAFHRNVVRKLAFALGKPYVAITVRPDLLQGIEDALRREDVYFVASDPRFAAKAAVMFANRETTHELRVLVAGRDDVSAVPAGATTYIMRRARELLHDHPLVARVPETSSIFARESRRAILSFIAQANLERVGARMRDR